MSEKDITRIPKIAILVTAKVTAMNFSMGFAKYVASRGVYVTLIADGLEKSYQPIGSGTLTTVPIKMERNPSLVKDFRSLFLLFMQLKRIKPDIITYATPKVSLLGSIAGVMARVPVRIYQLWGLRLETVSGPGRKLLSFMERITSMMSTGLVANSESLARRYIDLQLNSSREIEIPGEGSSHGVDLDYFKKDASYPDLDEAVLSKIQDSREFVIGFVGRLHPDKGIDTLLEAMQIVKRKGCRFKLLLIGPHDGAHFTIDEYLSEEVLLVGKVDDPRPYYAEMDVLILPSLREGFPNVVLEAASMEVPAIVSDGTGVVDSVVDNETGFVVPVGDAEAIAHFIEVLIGDGLLQNEMGKAARVRVEENFRQEFVWEQYLNLLTRK